MLLFLEFTATATTGCFYLSFLGLGDNSFDDIFIAKLPD